MAYIGKSIESGTFSVLDTSGNTYNGSNTTFNLGTQVGSPAQLLVSHDGVIQKPGTDYSLASGGTQITFSTAPASGASIFIVEISGAVGGPLDADLNGTELILDGDGDTSLHASTDDQIDVKIAGADDFKFTANTFTANSGSSIVVPDGGLTFGSTAISSTAAELNILDGVTATAAEINLIDGGTARGTTAIADGDGVLINDAGTMRMTSVQTLKTYIGGAGLQFISKLESSSDEDILAFDSIIDNTTYSAYKVIATLKSAGNGADIDFRWRDGGSALTSSNYSNANFEYQAELGTANTGNTNIAHANIASDGSTRTMSLEMTLTPAGSIGNMGLSTGHWRAHIDKYNSNTRKARVMIGAFYYVNSTVPDGFEIVNQTSNFEDYEVFVYGMVKA